MSLHPDQIKPLIDILQKAMIQFITNQELPPHPSISIDYTELERVLFTTVDRLKDNDPYNHPSYAGQMLKPPHPVAHLSYALSMLINPNNHALDGGRASSKMEKEVINILARFFGYETVLGHLTSSGTIANLEALFIAREIDDKAAIVFSDQAHYTHERMCKLLKLDYHKIPSDSKGRISLKELIDIIERENIGTIVCTAGTTALGHVDPIADIISIAQKNNIRVHVDAAYGGFFLNSNISEKTRINYEAVKKADSIVIDPHKHGLQPYGCGAILFKDPNVAKHYLHDSPYTYYSSSDLHLGEISLECSRAGSAAVAFWSTLEYFKFELHGFSVPLNACLRAAKQFSNYINSSESFELLHNPELDIVVYSLKGIKISEISEKNQSFFHSAQKEGLHISLLKINKKHAHNLLKNNILHDQEELTVLRSVFMKPEHELYLDKIMAICHSLRHL